MGFLYLLRLLHLGDGALRLADIRHTSRACSRPKWRASQRNGKVAQRAISGRRLAYSGEYCLVHPASQRPDFPLRHEARNAQSSRDVKVATDMPA